MTQALAHYYKILDGEARASYLKAKELKVDADLKKDERTLWEEHERAVRGPGRNRGAVGDTSLLDLKRELAGRMLENCMLCERRCGAARSKGEKGHCGVLDARISSDFIHMGEEPDLVPSYTIFFSGCTFNCVFCQNWDISTRPEGGVSLSPSELARKIELRAGRSMKGALFSRTRNVNWVGGDPTSNLPYILDVLGECNANLPQVWNSNMYLTEEAMSLLNGIVDVYLTDYKYGNDDCALRLSNAPDYIKTIQRNHLLGRAHAEMIVRHLVLPSHVECCTKPALEWIAAKLKDVKVNVMSQYRPAHRANEFSEVARSLKISEYREAIEIAEELGLELCD